jgi:hypothetical protein
LITRASKQRTLPNNCSDSIQVLQTICGVAACFLAAVDRVNHGTDYLQVALCDSQQLRVLYKSVHGELLSP